MVVDIPAFDNCHVMVVGDLMVDEYLWGDVDRISPEAPVQVVAVKDENYTLGGAGNVASNIVALGGKVSVVGVIGDGKNGRLMLDLFQTIGVDTAGIVIESDRTTTQKTRIIAANQHVLRIDRETETDILESTRNRIAAFITEKMPDVDVVLISDYGKGLVTKTLLPIIVEAAKANQKMTIVDPKGRDFAKYAGISMLTPNKKEAALASGQDIVDEITLQQAGNNILKSIGLEQLLITCGKDGMVLFGHHSPPLFIRADARQVYDVSGAGDTVLAVLGLALAAGCSMEESVALANTAAGIVVGKVGTATVTKSEIAAALRPLDVDTPAKLKTFADLSVLAKELRKKGRRMVLTNGCFDLLHAGHVKLLAAAKQLGDVLVVAIDDDESVTRIKGPGRPIIRAKERVRILCALDMIDYVVVFASEKLEQLIEMIRPDILVKGSNYAAKEVHGKKIVERLGGRVVLIPITESISSTRIIDHIKNGAH